MTITDTAVRPVRPADPAGTAGRALFHDAVGRVLLAGEDEDTTPEPHIFRGID
ncbi:hypothetical protein [Streptomyces eurocidicus]|uniref:Uncharacterized protein n=1 Tax=Streptomyces eurocidicus TaxID=66423 RepID=A0A7W8BAF4_STREU|nr:hypothetical protein [Streptomyces eurocidicus]MBB5119217.1 hypothetical protein [Streptomyces eurocidicus]MBF6053195.1 hypothetical protein [Streptomyces eurocidicus]